MKSPHRLSMFSASVKTIRSDQNVSISSCPIRYYGVEYNNIYIKFTNNKLAICFDAMYNVTAVGDCIIGPKPVASVDFSILQTAVRSRFQNVSGTSNCSVKFEAQLTSGRVSFTLNLFNFGTEAVMSVTSTGAMVSLMLMLIQVFLCSLTGQHDAVSAVYKPGSVVSSDPNTCFTRTCDQVATVQNSACGALETCLGNGSCGHGAICTVTANTVIDIHGKLKTIEDRCSYTLLSAPSDPDFQIVAHFRERRRTDVSFLESVVLQLNDVGFHIHLDQGNRFVSLQLNESLLSLNSSVRSIQGVLMSRDHRGVTAEASLSGSTASVFFDGHMAQIHVEGPAVKTLGGLCGKSSADLSRLRSSDSSCQKKHQQSPDSSIDCMAVAERCSLLNKPPFDICHQHSGPQPFITACSQTLCEYPALDGFNCQFLEAYARSCQLNNVTLKTWRRSAAKPAASVEPFSPPSTGRRTLWVGQKHDCRPNDSSKPSNREILSPGEPTVCNQSSASVILVGCLLEDKGIKHSALHLNDDTCRGVMDPLDHMVTFSFNGTNSCGAEVTTDGNKVIYTNTIKTGNITTGVITRHDQVYINFSCIHTQPEVKTAAFKIKDRSVEANITTGAWNYTLTMRAYSDPGLSQVVDSNTEVQLNQKIWVELNTVGLEGGLVALVTDSCWATKDQPPNSTVRHDLISNGCADSGDQTVKVMGNGLGTSNSFSFNMFQFSGSSTDVYLHCKLELCVKSSKSCEPVRRRDQSVPETPTRTSSGPAGSSSALMTWTK
uniref:ZP domain-containing protein n=1 Tax=Amphiprion percula TaxID=161767 RepID=A0A3P8TW81_AMPPE